MYKPIKRAEFTEGLRKVLAAENRYLHPALKRLIALLPEKKFYTGADRQEFLQRAGVAIESWRVEAEDERLLPLAQTPLQKIREEQVRALLSGPVSELRASLFGSPGEKVPFSTYPEAVDWIDREAAAQPHLESEQRVEILEKQKDLARGAEELAAATGMRCQVHLGWETLRYYRPGKQWTDSVPVARDPDSPIWRLTAGVKELRNRVGLSEPQLVAHVLAGRAIRLHRATMTTNLPNGPVTIRFFTPDMTLEDLKAIYQHIRSAWEGEDGSGGPKRLSEHVTDDDRRLASLLLDRWGTGVGEKPPASWDEVLGAWEEAGYSDVKADSLRVRWLRLSKKDGLGFKGG